MGPGGNGSLERGCCWYLQNRIAKDTAAAAAKVIVAVFISLCAKATMESEIGICRNGTMCPLLVGRSMGRCGRKVVCGECKEVNGYLGCDALYSPKRRGGKLITPRYPLCRCNVTQLIGLGTTDLVLGARRQHWLPNSAYSPILTAQSPAQPRVLYGIPSLDPAPTHTVSGNHTLGSHTRRISCTIIHCIFWRMGKM